MMFSENDFSGLDNPAKVRTVSTPNFFSRYFPAYTRLIVNISAKVVDEIRKGNVSHFG